MTRFVYFGVVPAELLQRFAAMSQVSARLLSATREGTTSAQLFAVAEDVYAQAGYKGAEKLHHQGGATGYTEREWVARPGGTEKVLPQQAFAWNPNLLGSKVEDTVLYRNGAVEVLTETPQLPALEVRMDGMHYRAPGVLIR